MKKTKDVKPNVKIFSAFEFGDKTEFIAGDQVEIQIMRTGTWDHPKYGEMSVDIGNLEEVKENFRNQVLGRDLYVDENHEENHKALAWIKEIFFNGMERLYATLELTKKGAELLTDGAYKYFSPEIYFKYENPETGDIIRNLLVGGAFTNTPFFKQMEPVLANEVADQQSKDVIDPNNILLFSNFNLQMDNFLQKVLELSKKGELEASKQDLLKEFSEFSDDDKVSVKNELINTLGFSEDDFTGEEEVKEEVKEEPTDEELKEEEAKEEVKEEEKEEEEEVKEEEEEEKEEEEEEVKEEDKVSASELADLKEKASQFSEMEKKFNELNRAKQFSEMKSQTGKFVFSESNKDGRILPKFSDDLAKIALSLNEKNRTRFFSILENVKAYSELCEEMGSSKEGEKANADNALGKFNDLVAEQVKNGASEYEAQTIVSKANPSLVELIG